MWIDPGDPDHIVTGSDGGVAISRDRGETWQFVGVLPVGQQPGALPQHLRPYGGQQGVEGLAVAACRRPGQLVRAVGEGHQGHPSARRWSCHQAMPREAVPPG